MWLATALLLTINDRSWGQTTIEIPMLLVSIDENSEAGTEVGALAELYPELNQFRLSNRSRSTLFQVHSDTGVISIRDGAKLDFEKRSAITLTIVADIREEQEDTYLAEFAESLRGQGFSSRTLSRLIPLEQRILVQVMIRDVEEADEVPTASSDSSGIDEPLAIDDPAEVFPVETASPEIGSTDSVMPELVTPEIRKPASELSPPKLSPPATHVMRPESNVAVENRQAHEVAISNKPTLSIVAVDIATAQEPEVPMPSDVPQMLPEPSIANRKTLALSGSSGQAAIQLNAATDDGNGQVASHSARVGEDPMFKDAEVEAAEVAVHLQRTFLLRSIMSLLIVLGSAYLLRHRWRSFKKLLPQRPQEHVTEQTAPEDQEVTAIETALEDKAELKAADDFVKQPVLDKAFPQSEQAVKSFIAQRVDEDNGAPFDPESLFNDDDFNDADDLQSLKAKNAQLGDRLEAFAGSVESAVQDRIPIDDFLTETATMSGPWAIAWTDKDSSRTADISSDHDHELVDGSRRDDGAEFVHGRSQDATCHEDPSSSAEPRWNSDWLGNPREKRSTAKAALTTAAETVAVLAEESNSHADIKATDNKITSLRNELADLFAIQKKAQASEAQGVVSVESVVQEAPDTKDRTNKPEACPEETHQESVAQYLSQLLERSKKEEAADGIFADRRKTTEKTPAKWDGSDRRGVQKAKAPVKSYIESYMSEHGGELSQDSVTQKSTEASLDEFARPMELKQPVERRPVDVQAIRQHMNSFRDVASTSLEHALASHRMRQAKSKVAGRTTLFVGLTLVSILAIATNSAMRTYYPSPGYLTGLFVCLAIAELILRADAIRKHRREHRYRILEPITKFGDRSDGVCVEAEVVADDASVISP